MPVTRRKSRKLESNATESFYISTEPTLELITPKDENEELGSMEKEMEKQHSTTIENKRLESESSSDEDEINNYKPETNKEKSPRKKKSLQLSSMSSKNGKNNRGIQYSDSVQKSLEQFLFGRSTSNQAIKRKLDSEDSSSSSPSSDDEDSNNLQNLVPRQSSNLQPDSSDEETSMSDTSDDENQIISETKNESCGLAKNENSLGIQNKKGKPKPAWNDEDDNELQVKDIAKTFSKGQGKHGEKEFSAENYAQSLRRKFTALKDVPKWADIHSRKSEVQDDSDDEFFRETTDMLDSGKKSSLEKGFLEFRKLKDMNEQTHNEGAVVRAAEFHPSASVGLVAGLAGVASLFQIDGKSNPKMQTVNFENYPIKTAHFTADGKNFVVGSQHFSHFYMYDMMAGKTIKVPWNEDGTRTSVQKFEVSPMGDIIAFHGRFGNIHIYSDRTRSKIFTLKMNDEITSCSFSSDGELLYSHGMGGEVYVWDVRAQECVHRFWDDGCVQGSAISVSRNNRYVATGSSSGIVNIYNRSELMKTTKPVPEKVVSNLTTTISNLKFSPTSEILAFSSEYKDNAVKLMHLPSMTVFQNFPPIKHNLMRPNCMDFSTNGGYFSVGNNRGAANLFRLKHFASY